MTASPAFVAGSLLGTSIVEGSSGWKLKVGKMPDAPNKVVVMYDTGGQPPNPRWAVDFPMIMASIRGDPNDYGPAWIKAREVRDALLGIDSQDVGSDRWVSVTCPGDIGFVGYDDAQRPLLSVNFRLIIEPSAVGNREAL